MNQELHRRPRALPWLLAISLGVNVALIAAAAIALQPVSPSPAPVRDDKAAVPVETAHPAPAPEPERRIVYITNQFEWRYLESTNCLEFAANLRAVGCPESTMRDILVDAFEEQYQARRRALDSNIPFWSGGRARSDAEQTNKIAQANLTREFESLFSSLLNIEWRPEFKGPFGGENLMSQAVIRFVFGPMPDERLHRVFMTMEKMDRLDTEMRSRYGGVMTEEDEQERRLLGLRLSQEFERVLTPMEWQEMRARMAGIGLFDDLAFHAIGLNATELRQLCLAWWDTLGHFDEFGSFDDWRTVEEQRLGEIEFTNRIGALLGPERFPDFIRARDPEFRKLHEFLADRKVSSQGAIDVFELRQFVAGEAKRLRSDSTLSHESRAQQLAEMQAQVRPTVEQLLGEKAYAEYLTADGAWMTNAPGL